MAAKPLLLAAALNQFQGSIRWDDPDLAIPWPIKALLVSGKDQKAPLLKDALRIF